MKIIKVPQDCKYLRDFTRHLESHCLINKGITGCGGTTVELLSERDSIILCPTKNLVLSKSNSNYLSVTGDTNNNEIITYINSNIKYKKIIATYDALERLMNIIPNVQDYFLLIDEYHLLFNDYSFRSEVIMFILNNFSTFKDWAFLTATPLKPEFILKELKDIPQITYEWENSVPVNITIKDTYFVQKELLNLIDIYKDRNLHIFLNSVSTISKIANKLNIDYRIVCSEKNKNKIKNFSTITSPIKKCNFYTSCSFEGCDIYDPNGLCVIVSDTNISTTVLDISTKIRQVCGRLRDSKYKDQVILILNTSKHRYAGTTKSEFIDRVKESERLGLIKSNLISKFSEDEMKAELSTYNRESYSNIYLNKYKNTIFFDENLKYLDIYNYNLISEIYSNSISVIGECTNYNFKPIKAKTPINTGLIWIIDKLKELNKSEYTYEELETIFKPLFEKHGLKWNKRLSISNFFPDHTKNRKMVNRIKSTYYKFTL